MVTSSWRNHIRECGWLLNHTTGVGLPTEIVFEGPACFSRNYSSFDELLQTVKNETTVSNLIFKGFLQASIPTLTSIIYAKEGL